MSQTVLTIAGSDPSGGAGIQADLKTFAAFEVFGKSVITSITSQNSMGVQATWDLPEEQVSSQLKSLLSDKKPAAVKTGMLGNDRIVSSVAKSLKRVRIRYLVVDPVIQSSSGKILLSKKGVERLKSDLLPLASLVTPNLREAEILSGFKIRTSRDYLKVAKAILKTGVCGVLIKGGHAKKNANDFYYDGSTFHWYESPRLVDHDLHGTGCVLSAAIAAGLANGKKISNCIGQAKVFMEKAIIYFAESGRGSGCVEPFVGLYQDRERLDLLQRVSRGIEILKENRIGHLIPEVQSNMGVGLKGARCLEEVIGFPGRIVKMGNDIMTLSSPQFGGSRHVADIVLTLLQHDPSKRAVMNIKFTHTLLSICRKLKFNIASFDRKNEPKQVKVKEGSSLEWGTDHAVRKYGSVPDIIFDLGGTGKEEMIRVIANDVESLVDKILRIHRAVLRKK